MQLIAWMEGHPLLRTILAELERNNESANETIDTIVNDCRHHVRGIYTPPKYNATTSELHSATCLAIISRVSGLSDMSAEKIEFFIRSLGEFLTCNDRIEFGEAVKIIRDVAVDGLYEFLDEHLDERNAIYFLLIKYKQRSEWFRKLRLRGIAENGLEGRSGERALAIDVQEYVLDQGVEFFVEPASSSGEVDLVLKSSGDRYLIIDAKYLREHEDRSAVVSKLAGGFHQVSRYCTDYSVPDGFLVCFVATKTRLRLELEENDGIPFLAIGGKNVYYIEILIGEEPSASKSGKAQEYEIARAELVSLGSGNWTN